MSLRLHDISRTVNGEAHIHSTSLELHKGTMNVLLGPTSAGKTSLMRLMAGLDRPDTGKVYWNDEDVTGRRVQSRDIAMVYQQFVNYPSMSVYENIASPLRIQRRSAPDIDRRVKRMAELLQLSPMLDRKPGEISGGQQQRCAIARALVKDVGLVLMDEPLANLDYKLREELRVEIPRLFEASGSIFVYATTEPEEALLLGGNTATLFAGRITQFGPSSEVYRHPVDELTARLYSDPPMNFMTVRKQGGHIHFPNGRTVQAKGGLADVADAPYRAGFRAHDLALESDIAGSLGFDAELVTTELTGSDTYLHVEVLGDRWVGLVRGIRQVAMGASLKIFLDPGRLFFFDEDGRLVCGPGSNLDPGA